MAHGMVTGAQPLYSPAGNRCGCWRALHGGFTGTGRNQCVLAAGLLSLALPDRNVPGCNRLFSETARMDRTGASTRSVVGSASPGRGTGRLPALWLARPSGTFQRLCWRCRAPPRAMDVGGCWLAFADAAGTIGPRALVSMSLPAGCPAGFTAPTRAPMGEDPTNHHTRTFKDWTTGVYRIRFGRGLSSRAPPGTRGYTYNCNPTAHIPLINTLYQPVRSLRCLRAGLSLSHHTLRRRPRWLARHSCARALFQ